MKHAPHQDPSLSLRDLMAKWPETVPVFLQHNMICVGCLIVPFHTVADACLEYDLDEDLFRAELDHAINGRALPD